LHCTVEQRKATKAQCGPRIHKDEKDDRTPVQVTSGKLATWEVCSYV
jgi:hypothetical protein